MNESHPVLLPRSTWPWPDLDAKLASVTAAASAGADLRRPLWLLRLPLIRRTNLGFITALVAQGVPVPQDVVLKTRDVLTKLADNDTTTPTWPRYARWLAELDRTAAAALLQDLALTRPEPQRYPAWQFLHEISPEDSVEVGAALVADPHVSRATRFRIGDVLAGFDLDTALAAFGRVSHGDLRNQAAEFIARHTPEKAVDLFAATAADLSVDDAHRLEASRHVLGHQRERGLDLHFALLPTASTTAVRTGVMDDLRREVPNRLTTSLTDLYRTGTPTARPDFARYLVEHLGGAPEVTATLANDTTQAPEAQFRALVVDPRAATPDLVTAIVRRFPRHDQVKVDAIAWLAALFPDTALDLLREVVADKRLAFRTRKAAIVPSARHLGPQRTVDLYRILAMEPRATREQRETAASAAAKVDKARGKVLYEELARNPDLSVDERFRLIQKSDHSLELLRVFAREAGPLQVKAAQKAASAGTKADRAQLLSLATSPSSTYLHRKPIIEKLPRADRITVLKKIIDSPVEMVATKLTAAIALGGLDEEYATKKLNAMADDRSLPRATRNQARQAVHQFR